MSIVFSLDISGAGLVFLFMLLNLFVVLIHVIIFSQKSCVGKTIVEAKELQGKISRDLWELLEKVLLD